MAASLLLPLLSSLGIGAGAAGAGATAAGAGTLGSSLLPMLGKEGIGEFASSMIPKGGAGGKMNPMDMIKTGKSAFDMLKKVGQKNIQNTSLDDGIDGTGYKDGGNTGDYSFEDKMKVYNFAKAHNDSLDAISKLPLAERAAAHKKYQRRPEAMNFNSLPFIPKPGGKVLDYGLGTDTYMEAIMPTQETPRTRMTFEKLTPLGIDRSILNPPAPEIMEAKPIVGINNFRSYTAANNPNSPLGYYTSAEGRKIDINRSDLDTPGFVDPKIIEKLVNKNVVSPLVKR